MTPDKDKAEIKRGKQLSIRQYRHNHGDGFVFGYDTDQMDALLASLQARIEELEAEVKALRHGCLQPSHKAADAFWKHWRENGETGRHGYYESTWGAINRAIAASQIVPWPTDSDGGAG